MEVISIISNLPLTAFIIGQASAANVRIKSKIVDQGVTLNFSGSFETLVTLQPQSYVNASNTNGASNIALWNISDEQNSEVSKSMGIS